MLLEQGHLVATKRGQHFVMGTIHQAFHFTSCKHSELTVTTQHVPLHVLHAMERLSRGTAGYIADGGAKARARARDRAKRNRMRVALLKEGRYHVDNSPNATVESSGAQQQPALVNAVLTVAVPVLDMADHG